MLESASALAVARNGFAEAFSVTVIGGSSQDAAELITERMELITGHELTLNPVVGSLLTGRSC